jgi:hypothetical protein
VLTCDICERVDLLKALQKPTFVALARIGMLCNRAEFFAGQDNVPILKRSVHCWVFGFMYTQIYCF